MKFAAPCLALFGLALSIWIVVPGPILPLFILSVGATEVWPVLALFNALFLVANFGVRGVLRPLGITAALTALIFTLVPPAAYAIHGPYVPIGAFFAHFPHRIPRNINPEAPVVLAIYGGAWQRGTPGNDAQFNATIASWGYRVIALDYPHAPAMHWPAQRDAIVRQIDALHASRIAVVGHSSGAQLALIAAALRPKRIDAVVTFESPVDLALGYTYPSQPDVINARQIISDLCGGTPEQRPSCYRSASPRYAVRAGMPPVLMVAGGRDHVADVRFERLLRDIMRADGVSVDYIELPWADHSFETVVSGFHDRIAMWYVRQFLAEHLKRQGYDVPSQSDAK